MAKRRLYKQSGIAAAIRLTSQHPIQDKDTPGPGDAAVPSASGADRLSRDENENGRV